MVYIPMESNIQKVEFASMVILICWKRNTYGKNTPPEHG